MAGVDEAGRGPLAGEVVAAAVILGEPIAGLCDSKKLNDSQRQELSLAITESARAWALGVASVAEIEQLNILQASLLAMRRALLALPLRPGSVLVDGKQVPEIDLPCTAVVRGDALVPEISAASILAKTRRDRMMLDWHRQYPQYGFDRHKGYPTAEHLRALRAHGPAPLHRKTYAPIRALLTAAAPPGPIRW